MSVHLLKCVIEVIAKPVADLVNICLESGHFPDELKIGRIVPIFKKGDPDDPKNYRPISILPVLGKVIEAVMKKQLVEFLENESILSSAQHGFRKSHSTVSAVSSLMKDILEAFEDNKSVALVMCDLSKAFDVISHDILLGKLELYGVQGTVLKTLESYLSRRSQVVSVGGAYSSPRPVRHGVPQGSILEPILFLAAINDLSSFLDNCTLLFADDTTLVARGKTPLAAENMAQTLLDRAKLWFSANKLKLNEEKTQFLLCTLSRAVPTADITAKLLGFKLHSKLSWEGHIMSMCCKLSRTLYLLKKLKSELPISYRLVVYHTLFHAHIRYGIILWGHSPACEKILKIQKRALRSVSGKGPRDHCRPLFTQLEILTVHNQFIMESLMYVKLNISNFSTRGDLHGRKLRNNNSLNMDRCRLKKTQDSFPTQAIKIFNSLPGAVKELSVKDFQAKIEGWLKSNPFYSLVEYYDTVEGGI